jgi:hypothetical protein
MQFCSGVRNERGWHGKTPLDLLETALDGTLVFLPITDNAYSISICSYNESRHNSDCSLEVTYQLSTKSRALNYPI